MSTVATTGVAVKGPYWALRLPASGQIDFHGMPDMDRAGVAGAMAYPVVGGALGFVAAVITHGLIAEGAKSAEKARLQESADQVLAPYRDVLDSFQHKELMQRSLDVSQVGGNKGLMEGSATVHAEADWVVDSTPQFVLTQDQGAIILDNVLTIRKASDLNGTIYQNTVRVVSDSQDAQDPKAFWGGDQGAKLKEHSVRLFAQSIDLALLDAQRQRVDAKPRKTVRYMEGKTERMERGEVVDDCCGRTVIRTLRGWLMSVPVKVPSSPAAP